MNWSWLEWATPGRGQSIGKEPCAVDALCSPGVAKLTKFLGEEKNKGFRQNTNPLPTLPPPLLTPLLTPVKSTGKEN